MSEETTITVCAECKRACCWKGIFLCDESLLRYRRGIGDRGGVLILRALSIRQPWSFAVASGWKGWENRPQNRKYRGPLLIHAGVGEELHVTTQPKQHAVVERRHREAAWRALYRTEAFDEKLHGWQYDGDLALARLTRVIADAEAGLLREEPAPSREAEEPWVSVEEMPARIAWMHARCVYIREMAAKGDSVEEIADTLGMTDLMQIRLLAATDPESVVSYLRRRRST